LQEVVRDASVRPSGGWPALAFWLTATLGVALFALGVLAQPWCGRLDAERQLAFEDAKVGQVSQAVEDLETVATWLSDDPKYLARQIRRDLGYRRPGDEPLPLVSHSLAPPLQEPRMPEPRDTRLDRLCRRFASPPASQASLAGGLMLMAVALIWFDLPTSQRRGKGDAE